MGTSGISGQFKFAGLVVIFLTVLRMPLCAETVLRPDLSARTLNAGAVLTWELLLPDVFDPAAVAVTELPQMDGGVLISNPVVRRNYIQRNQQSEQHGVRVVCLFRARQTGIRKISSAVISVENKTYRSSEHAVEVDTFYRNQSVLPPKIEWQIEKTTAFEGENVTAYLILKERRSLAIPERITVQPLHNGSLDEVKGLCPIRRYAVADILVFDLPLAAYFFTSEHSGRVALPEVTVAFEDLGVARTPPTFVEIQPLPEIVKRTNAVGDFSFSVIYEKKPLTEGSSFNVSLVLEGSGNLNRLIFPEIKIENLIETGSKSDDVWYRDGSRYSGVKRLNCQFVVEKGGIPVFISVPEFYWYSDVQNRIQKSAPVNLRLPTTAAVTESPSTPVGNEFPIFSPEKILADKEYNPFHTFWSLLIFLPGTLLLLLLPVAWMIGKKRMKKTAAVAAVVSTVVVLMSQAAQIPENEQTSTTQTSAVQANESCGEPSLLSEARNAFDLGQYAQALDLWGRWEEEAGAARNARLAFNRAVAAAALGRQSEAVYFSRKAIALNPMKTVYREFYGKLEREYELHYSLRPAVAVSGVIAFLFLGIGFNFFALFVFLSAVTKHRLPIVLATVCFLEIGLAAFGLGLYAHDRYEKAVILTQPAVLLKIPDTQASAVIHLAEGSVLSVLGETEQFYLLRNNLGITGWIEKTKLRKEF